MKSENVILHITQFFHPQRGYQENFLSKNDVKSGGKAYVIASSDLIPWSISDQNQISDMDKAFFAESGVEIIRMPHLFSISRRYFFYGLKDVFMRLSPTHVVIHGVSLPMSIYAMIWFSLNSSAKIIVDDHMVAAGSKNKFASPFYFFFKVTFGLFLSWTKLRIYKWIAVSEETREFMKRNYNIKQDISVVPLGYDETSVFYDNEGGEGVRDLINLGSDCKVIGYVGKINKNKSPSDMLEAVSRILSLDDNVRFLLVGDVDKNYISTLKNDVKKYGLVEKVIYMPSVENKDIRNIFSCLDVTVWPNGSSMAMLEAMACRCPVVAQDIKVNRERLGEGRGFLFNRNENGDLEEKILAAMKASPQVLNAAEDWVKNYSWASLHKDFMS